MREIDRPRPGWPDHDQVCPDCGVWASDAHECPPNPTREVAESRREDDAARDGGILGRGAVTPASPRAGGSVPASLTT